MKSLEVQDILQSYGDVSKATTNGWQLRTLGALSRCRTAAMGGHIDRCENGCGAIHVSYNSCRNRHCPKCQGHLREQWIENREKDLLNTSYFHVVFTLPSELHGLCLGYPKELYDLLFKVSWSVIRDFGKNPKFLGAQTGMIAVLHTWGQNLSLHPHLHCLVPSGGLTKSGKWKTSKAKGKYLFEIKAMKKVFRARFIAGLRKFNLMDESISKVLFSKDWVIYAKRPFYGPVQVIEYLGRYTHKVAISNHRLISDQNNRVVFTAKDYRKGGAKHLINLSSQEFIRRFSLHILPKGYTRIRHFGICSSTHKQAVKEKVDKQLGKVKLPKKEEKPILHRRCPKCRKGHLVTIDTFNHRGPPPMWLLNQQG